MPGKLSKGIIEYSIKGKRSWLFLFRRKVFNVDKIAPPASGGSGPLYLAFSMQEQLQANWCWAATATSVSIFYSQQSTWTQCNVAAVTLALQCCQAPHPCDIAWYLHEALIKTGNFNRYTIPLIYTQVEQELLAGRVIGCRIDWGGGRGHFVVIHGCRTSGTNQYFNIDDPSGGKTEITVTGFMSAYMGTGRWTHSFITKP